MLLSIAGLILWQQTGADPAPDSANRHGSREERSVAPKSLHTADGKTEPLGSGSRRELLDLEFVVKADSRSSPETIRVTLR